MTANHHFKLIIVIMFVFVLTGCKAQQHIQQTRSVYDSYPLEINYALEVLDENLIPPDVRMVIAAIVQQMRKDSATIPGISFHVSGNHVTLERDFDYQGFSVTSILLEEHWVHDTGSDSFICRVEGSLVFEDALGRRALNYFIADYELYTDRITILDSEVRSIDPIFPITQAFIIKAADLQAIASRNPDFNYFYDDVLSSAVSVTPTPEERRLRQELEEMSFFERIRRAPATERQDYFMIIFVMDRIMPDAGVEVVVTSSLHDTHSLAESMYRDFDGWRVAIFGGNFALDQDVFYAKTYYRPPPGILPDNLDQVLIGLFATEKNYETQQRQTQVTARPVTQQASYTPAEEPMALGRSSLNTSNRNDARVIQARLAELGFYNKAIDGLWGQGSRTALQNFQKTKGLTASGEWNTQTQMILFPLKISSRDDAAFIQTRLAELGFYNITVDGLWGQGSRTALQNFQRANGLTASGEWNIQTQMILFPGTGK